MSYFIFNKNQENLDGVIYKIAETEVDLNNLNIIKTDYKIIEDTQENFDNVKLNKKIVIKYINNTITYIDEIHNFNKDSLKIYVENFKKQIQTFLNNNYNHPLLSKWNNYYNQLNNLNLDNITYPLNKSLEQYFNDLGQPSLNPLQLP